VQTFVSDWEHEQLQKISEMQGIAQSDLLRDALRSVLGYLIPSGGWDYIEEWGLLWNARVEVEKLMKFLAEVEKSSETSDDVIADRVERARTVLTEISHRMANIRISGRKPKRKAQNLSSKLLRDIVEGRKPSDTEIIEVCQAEDLSEEKVFEIRDRLFNEKEVGNGKP
jgi:hypothetical protein